MTREDRACLDAPRITPEPPDGSAHSVTPFTWLRWLAPDQDQTTSSNGEYGHDSPQSRKAELKQRD